MMPLGLQDERQDATRKLTVWAAVASQATTSKSGIADFASAGELEVTPK
jgi:hypothetical protein